MDQSKTKENDVSPTSPHRSCHQGSTLTSYLDTDEAFFKTSRKESFFSCLTRSFRGKERCPSFCHPLTCIGWLLTHTIRTAQSQHQGSGGHQWKKAGHVQKVGAMGPACQLKEWTPSSSFLCVGNSSLDSGIRPKLLSPPYQSYQSNSVNLPGMYLLPFQQPEHLQSWPWALLFQEAEQHN